MLEESINFYEQAANLHPDVMIHTDSKGIITYISNSVADIFGYCPDELKGKNVKLLIDDKFSSLSDKCLRNRVSGDLSSNSKLFRSDYDILGRDKDGISFPIKLSISDIKDQLQNIIGFVGYIHDKRPSNNLDKFDSVYCLLNQDEFQANIIKVLSENKDIEVNYIVLSLDNLNSFLNTIDYRKNILNKINEVIFNNIRTDYGENLRQHDMVVGMLGYSFGIAVFGANIDQTRNIANRLKKSVSETNFGDDNFPNHFTASIGIVKSNGILDIEGLLNKGFQASQISSDNGGNRITQWNEKDLDKIYWKNILENALKGNGSRFELYGQYIKSIEDSLELNYEVLLRLFDSSGNIISPAKFIPIAEEMGLSIRIDKWVIENTFKLLSDNPEHMNSLKCCSINLSGCSLSDLDIYDFIYFNLIKFNINPRKISFEVTETKAISDMNQANELKSKLREIGCQIVIDDYGKGTSSSEKLFDKHIDKIKIDGQFIEGLIEGEVDINKLKVISYFSKIFKFGFIKGFIKYFLSRSIGVNKVNYTIIESICTTAEVLDLDVVAEFVNSEEEKIILGILGVDYFQGYNSSGKPFLLSNLTKKTN